MMNTFLRCSLLFLLVHNYVCTDASQGSPHYPSNASLNTILLYLNDNNSSATTQFERVIFATNAAFGPSKWQDHQMEFLSVTYVESLCSLERNMVSEREERRVREIERLCVSELHGKKF